MNAAQYWRHNKEWSKWIGRSGKVVSSTLVRVAAPQRSEFTPYSYVIVDFGSDRHEFMGTGHDLLQPGDHVVCVLRKLAKPGAEELIAYGIKVQKIL